jgi:hypothetical protein
MQSLLSTRPDSNSPIAKSTAQTLHHHFFRCFFDNDNLSLEAETETTVIRALCAFSVPPLMVAFWLLPNYPGRNLWATAADRYFFVLYGFVAMGTVTTFAWESLFPDRQDFLILLPLGLKPRDLFLAKGKALLSFLGMFLVAANLFAAILFPAVSTVRGGNIGHTFVAHFVAVCMAGIFSALTMLAIQGLTICLLPSAWFRTISTLVQSLSIAILLLLFLLFPIFGTHMQPLLEGHTNFAAFIPPIWYLGLYEHLIYGAAAPAASHTLAGFGLAAIAIVAAIALITYPLAWRRQQKRALEGLSAVGKQRGRSLNWLLHRTLLLQPQRRAVFHFVTQTISRNSRYQVYLAIYSGVGLALAMCCIVTLRGTHTLTPELSIPGLHAILPLLLFWMVLGLRTAFAFPVDMLSRWVFPISLSLPGLGTVQAARAAKLWTLLCCAGLTAAVWSFLLALHWSSWDLTIQAVFGAGLSLLLSDLFFLGRTQIPFTRARMPGRSGLPIILTLYAAFFPALVLFTVELELHIERRGQILAWIVLSIAALHIVMKGIDHLAQQGIIGGFPEDEFDDGPQTLGLSQ